jgi:hypothetical protein
MDRAWLIDPAAAGMICILNFLAPGVFSPAEQVNERKWKMSCGLVCDLGEVPKKGLLLLDCTGPSKCQRSPEDRVCTQPCFIHRSVQVDQGAVELRLGTERLAA